MFHIVINLLLSAMMETYYKAMRRDTFQVVDGDLELFKNLWGRFDPTGLMYLDLARDLKMFVRELGAPLGLQRSSTLKEVSEFIENLELKNDPQRHVYFNQLLLALVDKLYEKHRSEGATSAQQRLQSKMASRKRTVAGFVVNSARPKLKYRRRSGLSSDEDFSITTIHEMLAAATIQRTARSLLNFKRGGILQLWIDRNIDSLTQFLSPVESDGEFVDAKEIE